MSLYEACAERLGGNADTLLLCISDQYDKLAKTEHNANENADNWLFVICGAMVFFMQTGFAMVAAGAVRKKNVQNTMLKNLLDACAAAWIYYIIGFALAFGDNDVPNIDHNTFAGKHNFFTTGREYSVPLGFYFYQFAFSASSTTIVAGTLAERCRMGAYLLYSLYLPGWIFPITAHAMWSNHGFLSPFSSQPLRGIGVIDFAGSGVVHITGGTVALVSTLILGPRQGRFHDAAGNILAQPRTFPAYSLALQLLGTFVLWFGWHGFNAGSALLLGLNEGSGLVGTRAAANTALSGASGGLSAFLTHSAYSWFVKGEALLDLVSAMNGVLSGLVAVTAGCGTMDLWGALITGIIAGWLYLLGSYALVRFRIDDVVDSIPVHMVNGIWGLLACGLFSTSQNVRFAYGIEDSSGLFVNQIIGAMFIIAWSASMAVPFFYALNYFGILRSNVVAEVIGLDVVNLDTSKRGNAISCDIQQDIDTFRQELDKNRSNHGTADRKLVSSSAPSKNPSDAEDD